MAIEYRQLRIIAGQGAEPAEFREALRGIAIDAQRCLCAAGDQEVKVFDEAGVLLRRWSSAPDPTGFSGCCNPTNVTAAGPGLLCVTGKGGPRAKVYDHAGRLFAVINSADFDPNTRNMDGAVDACGRICVSDPLRLPVFALEPAGGAAS